MLELMIAIALYPSFLDMIEAWLRQEAVAWDKAKADFIQWRAERASKAFDPTVFVGDLITLVVIVSGGVYWLTELLSKFILG